VNIFSASLDRQIYINANDLKQISVTDVQELMVLDMPKELLPINPFICEGVLIVAVESFIPAISPGDVAFLHCRWFFFLRVHRVAIH
jgi:hypothetical protein